MSKEKLEGQNTHNNVLTAKGTKVFHRRNKVKAAIVACGLTAGIGGGIGIGYAIFHNETVYKYEIDPTSYEDAANSISWKAYQYDSNNKIVDTQSGTHKLEEDVKTFEVTFRNGKKNTFNVDWIYTPTPVQQWLETVTLDKESVQENMEVGPNEMVSLINQIFNETVDKCIYYSNKNSGNIEVFLKSQNYVVESKVDEFPIEDKAEIKYINYDEIEFGEGAIKFYQALNFDEAWGWLNPLNESELTEDIVKDNSFNYINDDDINTYSIYLYVLKHQVDEIILYPIKSSELHIYLRSQNYVSKINVNEWNDEHPPIEGKPGVQYVNDSQIGIGEDLKISYQVCTNFDQVVDWIEESN